MDWRILSAANAAACVWIAMSADGAMAQSFFHDPFADQYHRGFDVEMMMSRLITMAVAIGSGFALGWICSPQAQAFRRLVAVMGVALVVGFAVLDHSVFGLGAAWFVSVTGFGMALGYWAAGLLQSFFDLPTTFGSSQWATIDHMQEKDLFGDDGIILGSVIDGAVEKVFSYKGDRHLLTSAPTRSGKGVSHIIVNLLSYTGSMLVIDPKGENARITAQARREMGQEVHCVDPWHISGEEVSRFNPLDWIELGDVDATENAMLLADALVQKSNHSDAFWTEEAKAFLQGLILLVAFDEAYTGRRHLGTVRDLLLLGGDEMEKLFQQMANSPHHIIASTGARSLQKEPKLMASVLASAQAETHMLDSARLRESLSASDFTFEDLKKKPMTIFLILPSDRLNAFGRFLRLMVQQAITENARNIEDMPEKPVLFILDEMPALGRLTMVEQAYGLMAGFGIQLWGITQDLCQLRKVYGQDYESFIGNSGAVAYFGSPDKTSAEYFSTMCGVTTVWNFSSAVSNAFTSAWKSTSTTETETENRALTQRKLAFPDELMRLPENK
ncbi:type IV secretory system conjugative DNA transfer family protein [uncultured Roseobacter sp.]|uniref:type IV secretory system conjugative DNA transfer family protein n=1 Tax=uncultured Roseobacter sp. TaxID=114847 RepID=UPI00261DFD60|nr:type IV secretory system conjugative DNA transfer family protein [uncultured Roseobacter sp.]